MRKTLTISAVLLALAGPAAAQDVASGAGYFAQYCATCHGVTGTGNGPTGAVLTLRPTDLTRLSETNGGWFPVERVVRRIDGREPLVSHGSPMPIFGGFLNGGDAVIQSETGQPVQTVRTVADLVAFLESLQQQTQ